MPQNIAVQIVNLSSVFILIFKVLVRKNNLFQRGDFQEVFDPPHYELFTLRDKVNWITLLLILAVCGYFIMQIKHMFTVLCIA